MPVWFWIAAAALLGGAAWYGKTHGHGLADSEGSAYDSGASAASLLDYGISPSGNSAFTGYGGSFVLNPSLVSSPGGGGTTTAPPGFPPAYLGPPVPLSNGSPADTIGGTGIPLFGPPPR